MPPIFPVPVAVLFAPLDSKEPDDAILIILFAVNDNVPPVAAVPLAKLFAAAFNLIEAFIKIESAVKLIAGTTAVVLTPFVVTVNG